MNRALRTLYITLILFASCEQPTEYIYETEYVDREIEVPTIEYITEYIEVETEPIIETEYIEVESVVEVIEYIEVESLVEVPVVETVYEYVDNIVYEYKEVYIMSETTSNEMAITEYDNYVTTNNKVYGVSDGDFILIERVTGLFKKDGILYFNMEVTTTETTGDETETTTEVKPYSQVDGVLTALDELPDEPESERVEFESSPFKIVNAVSGDIDCSFVYNGTVLTGFLEVDGACMMDDDLLFSVSTTYSIRYEGVYKYDVDDGAPRMKFDNGRIW